MTPGNYLPLHQGEVIEHRWSMLAESIVHQIGTGELWYGQTPIGLQVMATGIAKSNTIVVDCTGIQLVTVL
jgi:hypothetical protein